MSVVTYTREELARLADAFARDSLGCSFVEACRQVDGGQHQGTVIKQKVEQYRWLLEDE